MGEKRRILFTLAAISLVGVATGLFLHGDLLAVNGTGLDQYNKLEIATANRTAAVHGHDGFGQHEHTITEITMAGETTPHGNFPGYVKELAPWAFTNTTIAKQGTNEFWIYGRDFWPNSLTVPSGTKITWNNKSAEQHTVSSNESLFDGIVYMTGSIQDSFSYTFIEPGTYYFYCRPHAGMTGKVTVTAR